MSVTEMVLKTNPTEEALALMVLVLDPNPLGTSLSMLHVA